MENRLSLKPPLKGHTEIVKADHGARVDLQDNDGDSALINASREGHTETVKELLNHGAHVDLQNKHGKSALIKASSRGHTKTVKALLGKGAKVDLQNKYGESALIKASLKGHIETVKALLDHGAQVTLQYEDGDSALKRAQDNVHEVVQLLSKKGRLNLPNTLQELLPLASEWQIIGTFLAIPPGKLETIKSDNPNKVENCLREMLTEWLKTNDPDPTWENLADVIHRSNPKKAKDIRQKYCTTLTS